MTRSGLIASAQILTGERIDDPRTQRRPWHDEAWSFYDESGPLRYGVTWISKLISKARLYAARITPGGDEPEPIDSGPAADAIEALAGGMTGQSQMLQSLAVQLMVPGIGYLVGTDEGDTWRVYSSDVIRLKSPSTPISSAIYEIQVSKEKWQELDDESLVIKVWRPHERFYWEADSPARAALDSLRELRRIGQYIDAVLSSRLAGAGILTIPQEASFPTAPGETGGKHPFVTEIMQVMMTAIKQPGTAAAVVPIPVEIPAELADGFKHITFATELSDKVLSMRESALRQTSISLDIPAEILTGMGDVNHWGAWQLESSAIKVHAEPLLEVITSALTEGYLHPLLETANEDFSELVVWADTSELTARPDRSDDAIQLYDRGQLTGNALRRETGMDETDKPEGEELEEWAFKLILSNPQLATTALAGLGIELPNIPSVPVSGNGFIEEPDDVGERSGAARETMPDTEGELPSENGETPPEFGTVLILEAHVRRALERAGNRIRSINRNDKSLADCPAERAHCCVGGVDDAKRLLLGAWDWIPDVSQELGLNPVVTIRCLDSYCQTLLEKGFAYDRKDLIVALHELALEPV